ncbi:MAG: hypothetical protein CFH30_01273 [Alphaproteobacteria bacterium MarineAlpha8_Bin1]|nr:MAG: hypothetical protein CFH30_01273 [Alphaproteobacteria bacterium MarineAlpha8_Bin1]
MQNKPRISVIHPSCRPDIARQTREEWLDLASDPDSIEYLLCIDSKKDLEPRTEKITSNLKEFFYPLKNEESVGPVTKINYASKHSLSNCLLFAADDLETFKDWDYSIANVTNWEKDTVLKITDNTEHVQQELHPHLIVNPAISRSRYEKFGYFVHPDFYANFSDTFLSFLAHKDDVVIEDEKIKFYHNQHKYQKQTSDHALERSLDEFQWEMHKRESFLYGQETFYKLAPNYITKAEVQNLSEEFLFANQKRKNNILFVLNSINIKNN